MIYPSYDKLDQWCKYSLVTLAAKRAKQIKGGAPPLIATTSKNPLTIALEEIAQGKVTCVVADNDDIHIPPTDIDSLELFSVPADIVLGTDESLLDDIDIEDEEEEEDGIAIPTLVITDDEENWEEVEVDENEEHDDDPAIIDDVDEDEPLDLDAQTGQVASELKIDDNEDIKPKTRRKKADIDEELIVVGAPVINIVDDEPLDLEADIDIAVSELSTIDEEVKPKKRGRKSNAEKEQMTVAAAVPLDSEAEPCISVSDLSIVDEEVKPKKRGRKSNAEKEQIAIDSAVVEDVKPKAKRKKGDIEDKPIVDDIDFDEDDKIGDIEK